MADQILIRGLRLTCHLGVPEAERAEAQTLRVHLTMEVSRFLENDEIEDTVDYKEVSDRVVALAAERPRKLIETLALEIAGLVLTKFPVTHIKVELEKFILPETDWVGVVVERSSSPRN